MASQMRKHKEQREQERIHKREQEKERLKKDFDLNKFLQRLGD